MSLKKVVKEMREVAQANPHNLQTQPLAPSVCRREVEYQGVTYEVVLTYNIAEDDKRRFWQFSVSLDDRPVPEEHAFELATEFLGDGLQEIELPPWFIATFDQTVRDHILKGHQRQFMSMV